MSISAGSVLTLTISIASFLRFRAGAGASVAESGERRDAGVGVPHAGGLSRRTRGDGGGGGLGGRALGGGGAGAFVELEAWLSVAAVADNSVGGKAVLAAISSSSAAIPARRSRAIADVSSILTYPPILWAREGLSSGFVSSAWRDGKISASDSDLAGRSSDGREAGAGRGVLSAAEDDGRVRICSGLLPCCAVGLAGALRSAWTWLTVWKLNASRVSLWRSVRPEFEPEAELKL